MATSRPRLVTTGPASQPVDPASPRPVDPDVPMPTDDLARAADPLLEFPAEAPVGIATAAPAVATAAKAPAPNAKAPAAPKNKPAQLPAVSPTIVAAAAGVLVVLLGGYGLVRAHVFSRVAGMFRGTATSKLTVDTRPAGAEVFVDGQRLGLAPLSAAVAAGTHTITVRYGADERNVPLTLAKGAEVAQYFDMKLTEPAPAPKGSLAVVTDPPGARVRVDGQLHGPAPISISDLAPGEHKVSVQSDTGTVERKVIVEANNLASVVIPLPKVAAPLGGWVTVSSPFDVQVLEGNDLIGESGAARIMLAAGRHDISLVNKSLGFQETRKLEIAAGKTSTIRIDPPKAQLSANARPWADVIIDGNAAGQTPIANISLTVGTHQVVFRHPQFGERRQTVVVTAKGPNRVGVDFTKPE